MKSGRMFKYRQKGRRIVLTISRDLIPAEVKQLKRWLRVLRAR